MGVGFGTGAGALQTDGGDFLVSQREFGNTAGTVVSGGGVPEPTSGALFAALQSAIALRRNTWSAT